MSIGWRTIRDDIELHDGDFVARKTHPSGALPPGTTAEIVWATTPTPTTWTAEIDGGTVSWLVDAEDVADIPTATRFQMFIHYPNPDTGETDDYEWVRGVARR